MSYIGRLKERLSSDEKSPGSAASDSNEDSNANGDRGEYDGPRLGEMVKFNVLVGPEKGVGVWPADEGAIYITPESAYQYRNGEWQDMNVNTANIYRGIATYVNPDEIRRRQQR